MSKIVIIEDEANIRLFISINLKARNYTVFEAATGAQGLQLLRDTSPDALILDMMLPDMTGWNILDEMSQDEQLKNIPVILMTASINVDETKKYPNLVHHLVKPASVERLLEAVQSVISPHGDTN